MTIEAKEKHVPVNIMRDWTIVSQRRCQITGIIVLGTGVTVEISAEDPCSFLFAMTTTVTLQAERKETIKAQLRIISTQRFVPLSIFSTFLVELYRGLLLLNLSLFVSLCQLRKRVVVLSCMLSITDWTAYRQYYY